MISRSTCRRVLFFLACASVMPLAIAACNRDKPKPVEEAAAPPPPPPASSEVPLAPLEEDAGDDADADAGVKKYGGPGYNQNQIRIRQCCAAIQAQAKGAGMSPEAMQLHAAAQTCYGIAAQAGKSGNAPEMAPVRQALAGKTLPSACSGM